MEHENIKHKWRVFNINSQQDILFVENLIKQSGSKSCAREAAYVRRLIWQCGKHPEKLLCEIVDECAFYMMTLTKKYARGAFTIVKEDMHGKGYGKMLNQRRFIRMKQLGLNTFKFRTNMAEPAFLFWQKQGAKIVGVHNDDFEMEIKIQ